MAPSTVSTTVFILAYVFGLTDGDPQTFLQQPTDVSVVQGQSTILKCQIGNKKGSLQWTKDGFALGFDRQIPGFPRYSMGGSQSLGEYHLVIENAQLEDDAEYQCQVGPAGGDAALLGRALLSLIIPPQSPTIEGYQNGSTVKFNHDPPTLSLSCLSQNGKPAATFRWLQNGVEISEGAVYSTESAGNKLQNGKSILTFTPKDEDNEAYYTCQASNEALQKPLSVTVQLNVMYPPGLPEISGYSAGQVVKTGDTMKLICVSRGGNPLAQVFWYRNNEELDFSYNSGNNRAENELIFTVQPQDNNAIYKCQASNSMTKEPLTTEVKLTVQFAPEKVSISGHLNAKAGETILLSCESSISNPPAVISWFSRGRPVFGGTNTNKPSPKGGFITTSEIRVLLTDRENGVIYQCHGTNEALGQTVVDTVTLQVTYPPERPTIAGYTEGKSVYAGNVQSMTCTSVGGNPPATLIWKKGDKEIEGAGRITGNIVSSQVSFLLKPDDNNAEYRCEASNSATVTSLIATVRLKVSFPPKSLNITLAPKVVKVGQELTITCTSSSSNPASQLSWWKDGDEFAGTDGGIQEAEFGGKSTVSRLTITPMVKDHGQIYACRATNVLLEQAVSDAVTLNVLYKPYFPPDTIVNVDVVEHQWIMLNLSAIGNPQEITYNWYYSGQKLVLGRSKRDISKPKFLQSGPELNMTDVLRTDAGSYTCEAMNVEGSAQHLINLNVLYPAEIVSVSSTLVVDQGESATLECVVRANPSDVTNLITWSRAGFDMGRTMVEFGSLTSRFQIFNTIREDSGEFVCTASNGVGEPATRNVQLLVKFAPIIDKTPMFSKAAGDKGSAATLHCVAEAVPNVEFSWFKDDVELKTTDELYSMSSAKRTGSLLVYESQLIVQNITKSDYGKYRCVARNELGDDYNFVFLDDTSPPDSPYDLELVNTTHNSLTLAWKPGFDGGAEQKFQVRFNEVGKEGMKYEDVVPQGAKVYTVKDLKLGTEYELTVKGMNRLGDSLFQEKVLKARTAAVAPVADEAITEDIPLIIILTVCIVGLLLLGLNILLILFFIRRRRKKFHKDVSSRTSPANTLEMFNPPNAVEDSKSNTTFDQRSIDDFPDDYKPPFDPVEEDSRRYGPMSDPYYPNFYPHGHSNGGSARGAVPGNGVYSGERGRDMHRPYSSGPFPGFPPEQMEEEAYKDQLRRMQMNLSPTSSLLGGHRMIGSNGQLAGTQPNYGPSPPARSSSRGNIDPNAPNSYEDVHPYDPSSPMLRGQGYYPPEMRGHLV